jgi:uncharacterized protein (TIGR02452 family)
MNTLSRRRVAELGAETIALDFVPAVNAGGGFLTGAMAREELLVRSSGLFARINGNPMSPCSATTRGRYSMRPISARS